MIEQKTCRTCHRLYSQAEFERDGMKRRVCRACRAASRQAHRVKKISELLGIKKHQLAEAEVKQKSACAICKKQNVLMIDHCHEKNIFRGLLCRSCNLGLGHFRDKPRVMLQAVLYVFWFDVSTKIEIALQKIRHKGSKLFHVSLDEVEGTGQPSGQES